jgi:ankyrin repeat protein
MRWQPGVDVNALDARGNTALHIAAHFGDKRAVDALLAHGAASLVSRAGLKPFDEAVAGGWRDVAAVLLKEDVKRKVEAFRAAWPQAKAELEKQANCHWAMQWVFDVFHIHMSVLAPSDTYHVYKRGADIRADYTLLGFKLQANHARLSILLRDGRVYAINHDAKTIQFLSSPLSASTKGAAV